LRGWCFLEERLVRIQEGFRDGREGSGRGKVEETATE